MDSERRSSTEDSAGQPLQFMAGFEGSPEKPIDVMVYAFDRDGNLLASAPLREGTAALNLTPDQARTARIFFAPSFPEGQKERAVTLDMMERLRAYEAVWQFDPKQGQYTILPIPQFLWKWWLWCLCRVRGQVVKSVTVGGVTQDMPVCNARVHICEVDPIWWIIPRLPDPLIIRLRAELLKELARPRPIPLPDPPPFELNPGVVDPSPANIARLNQLAAQSSVSGIFTSPGEKVELNPQPLPPRERTAGMEDRVALNPQPLPPKERAGGMEDLVGLNPQPEPPSFSRLVPGSDVMLNPQPLPPREATPLSALSMEAQVSLRSASIPVLRQALQNNIALIRPYICLWPWIWPWLCRCDEFAVVMTDAQGRFDVPYWYLCAFDQPDLYFWVEYSVGGSWTTVYHPNPVCCYTYWNYACGSEVTIRVTDPRVVPCGNPPQDLPGKQVAILSIGQNVSLHQIPVDSTGSAPLSGSATEGLAYSTNPFGGVLEPRVWFSRSALIGMNITHYRWSYRQLTDASLTAVSDTWHAMDRQVIRHYAVFNPITSSLSFPAYPLGPDPAYPGENLFQIQPINAPTGRPEDWAPIDAHEDLASAFFLSHLTQGGNAALGAGKYELKLELFDTGGGTPAIVDWSTSGISPKIANIDAPFGSSTVTTIDADSHYQIVNGSGHMVAFRLVLHVDNNACTSALYPISGMGLTVDADCGFVQYAPNTQAHISFMVRHPNDFVTLYLRVVRGVSIDVPTAESSGQVNAGPIALNGFNRSGDVFAKDVAVHTLLTENTPTGHTECTKAAFAETLYAWAMATDGWQRCSWLDPVPNPQSAAFALEPA